VPICRRFETQDATGKLWSVCEDQEEDRREDRYDRYDNEEVDEGKPRWTFIDHTRLE
jgi:hypothetical protein